MGFLEIVQNLHKDKMFVLLFDLEFNMFVLLFDLEFNMCRDVSLS